MGCLALNSGYLSLYRCGKGNATKTIDASLQTALSEPSICGKGGFSCFKIIDYKHRHWTDCRG